MTSESVPVLSAPHYVVVTVCGHCGKTPSEIAHAEDGPRGWAEWIVREHPVRPDVPRGRISPAIYDWACAECTAGQTDPPTIPGFQCVPHQAHAALTSEAHRG